MKIASFNVNGINARLKTLLAWLKETRPDVAVLQEIKCTDEKFPSIEIEELGYNIKTHGQKSFNGLAILSLTPISSVKKGLTGDTSDNQSRWIEAEINGLQIFGLYLPNGNPCPGPKFDYKIAWMNRLYTRAQQIIASEQPAILLGLDTTSSVPLLLR